MKDEQKDYGQHDAPAGPGYALVVPLAVGALFNYGFLLSRAAGAFSARLSKIG